MIPILCKAETQVFTVFHIDDIIMMNYELLNAAQSIEQLITSATRLTCRKCHTGFHMQTR